MRWAVFVLLLANFALTGYLVFIDRGTGSVPDVRVLELNADKVKLLKAIGAEAKTACLEWRNLGAADLQRAQEQLAKLSPGKFSLRERVIVISDPSPALVARIAELKTGFAASELKAVACPSGGT